MVKAYALALLLPTLLLGAVPTITRPVTDPRGLLSAVDTERVSQELVRLRNDTGVQMAVLVVGTTGGEPIEDYAMRAAQAWRGGQAGEDNGLLFVLAVDDRRMRLDVGYGLEEHLPDGAVRRLLDAQLPLMRQRAYAGAILHIIQGIRGRLPGAASAAPPSDVAAAEQPSGMAAAEQPSEAVFVPPAQPRNDYQRIQAFYLMLWAAALLFVWVCVAHHPGLRLWWGERTPLVLSRGGALLALGYAVYAAWGMGETTVVLLFSFCLVCGSLIAGRHLLFQGGYARVGIALIIGPLMGSRYAASQGYAHDTFAFTDAFLASLAAGGVVMLGSFENFFNMLLGWAVYLVGGSAASKSFGSSPSQRYTFTLRGSSSTLRSSSSSSGGSSSSSSSWGGGGGGFGGGGASSSW
ncbi:TPM domain-containing protein [Archangium gephyra]|uniref:TPM domain-containing protein n=1 Tax=Archangium gephyra TaxID=48 RepID=UPI003B81D726